MKTFLKKGDCLGISHKCLFRHALFFLIHKVKPECQLEVEHKPDSQNKHFNYRRGPKESTTLFSKMNGSYIQDTGSKTCSFNTVAVGWQVAILEPFKARGCWRNLGLVVLAKTVSIKQSKMAGGKYDRYSCIVRTYEETLVRCSSEKPQVMVQNMP